MVTIYNIFEMLNLGYEPIIDCEEEEEYLIFKSEHCNIQIRIQK